MSRGRPVLGAPGVLLAAVLVAGWLPASAPVAGAESPEVVFYAPSPARAAYGETDIEVDVYADEVAEVVFLVDGGEVARLREPPFRVTVPLGDDLGSHRFEVVVLGSAGEIVRGAVETPPLRVDEALELELRQLYITVGDAPGATPLAVEDFVVRDNGRRQKIVTFETGDAALAVSLLIDSSESMRGGRLEAALEGARAFARGMRPLDETAIYLFSDSIRYLSAFSQSSGEIASGLAEVEPAGGTAINDVLYAALTRLESRQGRRVVVLLSDGVDAHSALGIEEVLWAMRRGRSLVYWIELVRSPAVTSPWRNAEQHVAEHQGLRALVEESGGRVVPIESTEEAVAAFDAILAELRRQYVLGYYPVVDLDDGSWHEVEVRVGRRRGGVRTRGGYVD